MGYKEKLCEKCGKSYLPTGPRQRFCIDCRPKVADMADINALRSAVMKQAKKDGAIDRMIENGAAAQLFPGTDPEYIRRLAKEEKPLDGFVEYTPPEEEPLVFIDGLEVKVAPPITGPAPEEKKEEETMPNYEKVVDVWSALMLGKEVLAVDLASRTITDLQMALVNQVHLYLQDGDVVFYAAVDGAKKDEEANDGGEA